MKERDSKTAEFERMLEEATIDCYNEEEEFSGVLCTLENELKFPFDAIVMGKSAKVLNVDDNRSSLRSGIMMKVEFEGKKHSVALAMVEVVDKSSNNEKWVGWGGWWGRRG